MSKPSNINDEVWVILTEHGEKIWADSWRRTADTMGLPLGEVPAAIRDAAVEKDGRVRFQLWELMSTFGGEMYMGNPNSCFVENKIWFQK